MLTMHPTNSLLNSLMNSLPEGIMVFAQDLTLIYQNQKATEICDRLSHSQNSHATIPPEITELCQQLLRATCTSGARKPIIQELETSSVGPIRLSCHHFQLNCPLDGDSPMGQDQVVPPSVNPLTYILVVLKSCDESFQEELWFEEAKFGLTRRELEIWSLLKRGYSYQEISRALYVSLNTVKTHIKNIRAKRQAEFRQPMISVVARKLRRAAS